MGMPPPRHVSTLEELLTLPDDDVVRRTQAPDLEATVNLGERRMQ